MFAGGTHVDAVVVVMKFAGCPMLEVNVDVFVVELMELAASIFLVHQDLEEPHDDPHE